MEEMEAEEQEEEEEAKNIQQRLAANLSEEDYDLNLLQVHPSPDLQGASSFSFLFQSSFCTGTLSLMF